MRDKNSNFDKSNSKSYRGRSKTPKSSRSIDAKIIYSQNRGKNIGNKTNDKNKKLNNEIKNLKNEKNVLFEKIN